MEHPLEDKMNQKLIMMSDEGCFSVRTYHRKNSKYLGKRYLFKCGCCDEKVEIYYGGNTLEINGVIGSKDNWKELLLPLLDNEE